ncbi:MAG: triose-phosphate isomerase [Candidatus Marinimicrobia bacterium]|nr:triose-phosphate isomerase [Candidatus Neomarinimicrobiota bacterium]
MRIPIVAGNWKMNKCTGDGAELAVAIARGLPAGTQGEVVVCPPAPALSAVAAALAGSRVALGAQNMHWEASGAYTGEMSAEMLKDVGCRYVILGHSERRQYFGETDEGVNRKAMAALAAGLVPIVCVGETLEQRESDQTAAVITTQVRGSLAGIAADELRKLVVAYEPVWAIGTGRTASPAQAQEVHALIRGLLAGISDAETAAAVRLQYGGSVKADNAAELFGQPDIDGGLIGGAALTAESFLAIVQAAG